MQHVPEKPLTRALARHARVAPLLLQLSLLLRAVRLAEGLTKTNA